MSNDLIFLGTRSVYNGGNSKNITIPAVVLKELKKEGIDTEKIEEANVYYNKKERNLIVKFVLENLQEQQELSKTINDN